MKELQVNWDMLRPQWKYILKDKVEARQEDDTGRMLRRMGLSQPVQKGGLPNEYTVCLPMAEVMKNLGLGFKPSPGSGAGMMAHHGALTFMLRDGPRGTTRIHIRSFR